ncbi:CDP-diacylglycerol-glycerol-3-phosphate 3-phosphatidyltransferase [Parasponia andersonii]|uniref:CDP-diacylglycerol-glycerol-3-phosphate 3-phosphatidyltransferase n=1 Tax=Parasponia andersonii TaxID=3476 RepID=A0A2P5BFN7_PARAD|nr:CDP-diacylglycerol-glycerol-3-phosphate 3-phosphatidyltransferase [Parasponia andersonii]
MERAGSSYETSWADQWDYNPDPIYDPKKSGASSSSSGSGGKYKQKVGEGLVKTKAVASSGVKKVKEGTTVGFQWIKDKYHKTTQKH